MYRRREALCAWRVNWNGVKGSVPRVYKWDAVKSSSRRRWAKKKLQAVSWHLINYVTRSSELGLDFFLSALRLFRSTRTLVFNHKLTGLRKWADKNLSQKVFHRFLHHKKFVLDFNPSEAERVFAMKMRTNTWNKNVHFRKPRLYYREYIFGLI